MLESKMNTEQLKQLVAHGESATLEFKERISTNKNTAIIISSFANSFGGTLLIGVTNKRKIRGVQNPEEITARISKIAINEIDPSVQISTELIETNNKFVIRVEVPQSRYGPHAIQGAYYHRRGEFSGIMSPKELQNEIEQIASESENEAQELKHQIGQLIKQNDKIYQNLKKAQSWKIKAIDLILGALVGGILSIILTSLL